MDDPMFTELRQLVGQHEKIVCEMQRRQARDLVCFFHV
jgi:hypothetical protein